MLLFLAFHRIIHQDARLQDVQLLFGKEAGSGQERAPWILERIGKEETEYETAGDGEGAHESKEPEPAGFATDTSHVQDSVG